MRRLIPLLALALAPTASAQTRDLGWLALQWARGSYRAPVVCEIDGVAHRGFRRVLISPGPRHVEPAVDRIRFYDLEVPRGTRCVTETRGNAPNVIGSIAMLLRATSRPDTADRDFAAALRRDGGFDYEIVSGRLKLGPSEDPQAAREVDFKGGTARLTSIERGSDAYRRLAEFVNARKLKLVLEATEGTRLEFDLVQFETR